MRKQHAGGMPKQRRTKNCLNSWIFLEKFEEKNERKERKKTKKGAAEEVTGVT